MLSIRVIAEDVPDHQSSNISTWVVVGLWLGMVIAFSALPYCAKRQDVQPPSPPAQYDDGTPHLVVLSKRLPLR